jgi:hypothetical protein
MVFATSIRRHSSRILPASFIRYITRLLPKVPTAQASAGLSQGQPICNCEAAWASALQLEEERRLVLARCHARALPPLSGEVHPVNRICCLQLPSIIAALFFRNVCFRLAPPGLARTAQGSRTH